MPKTYWCQCCERYNLRFPKSPCDAGHTPRYYQPKTKFGVFGHKRKCGDFKPAALQPMWKIMEDLRKSRVAK